MRRHLFVLFALLSAFTCQLSAQVYAEMLLSDKKGDHKPIQSLSVPGNIDVYNNLHHHGPAFESNLVGYRIYFDHRQTVDIYGKRHQGLEFSHTQFYPTAEDIDNGYGDDVLWAGTTVSVGSFRGMTNGKPSFIEPVAMRTESILEYGPQRTVVEVLDKGWEYEGQLLDMKQTYTLESGHRDVRVDIEIMCKEAIRGTFCTGVRLFPEGMEKQSEGSVATWGSNWAYGPKDTTDIKKRATVGLAVCVPNQKVVRSIEKDNENMLIILGTKHPKKTLRFTYYLAFCSAKEEWEGSFHTPEAWFAWVDAWKKELEK